jgi:hypothetical protein
MPGLDRTGPRGRGSRTGRGWGRCQRDTVTDRTEQREQQRDRSRDDLLGVGRGGKPRGGGRGFCRGGKDESRHADEFRRVKG